MTNRLSWVKKLGLRAARMVGQWVPRVEPARPVSQLTRDIFRLLREAMAMHPARFYQDGNFPSLLDAAERFLVYVSEEDGHYAGWLAQAMLLVHDLVHESRVGFEPTTSGDLAWLEWASGHPISAYKPAER